MAIRQVSMDELPPEGDQEEAERLIRQMPLKMPQYDLKRVHVATLNVDYAPPFGSGYARPLSEGRLRVLRRDWDSMACSPLVISKRRDNTYWVVDGNHRRKVAFEKGITTLPAMIFTGLEREREADLYTKLGTVLGQTPWTRFQSKLVAGDESARDIVNIAARYYMEIVGTNYQDGHIQAVARLEWIYARGGPDGLDWTLGFLAEAFSGDRESLGEMQLEGVFGFYQRYWDHELVKRDEVARILGASGINAWHNRAAAIWGRVDVGKRSNTYGMAIADMANDTWRKKGVGVKKLLPAWQPNVGRLAMFRQAVYMPHPSWKSPEHDPAPQQLGEAV